MSGKISVAFMYKKVTTGQAIDTTSKSGVWSGLSPFNLGPCDLYEGRTALNMENAWQFAKVYAKHADLTNPKPFRQPDPTPDYWAWAEKGWADPKPHRYPMGKGAVPLYSLWDGKQLSYIEARKKIYGPLYAKAVQTTQSYKDLKALVESGQDVTLRDFDGYDHETLGLSLTDVLNKTNKKMGHAFVLKALLTNDPVLKEFGL